MVDRKDLSVQEQFMPQEEENELEADRGASCIPGSGTGPPHVRPPCFPGAWGSAGLEPGGRS